MAASSAAKLRTRGKFKLSLSSTVVALTILTFPLALAGNEDNLPNLNQIRPD